MTLAYNRWNGLDTAANPNADANSEPSLSDHSVEMVARRFENGFDAAARSGNVEQLRLCIQAGISVDHRDQYGRTPLMLAAREQKQNAVRFLLEAGADATARSDCGTPITYAANGDDPIIVNTLVEAGASLQEKLEYGVLPIHIAAGKGCSNVVRYILQCHPEQLNAVDAQGYTPLDCAVSGSRHELAKLLRKMGATESAKLER